MIGELTHTYRVVTRYHSHGTTGAQNEIHYSCFAFRLRVLMQDTSQLSTAVRSRVGFTAFVKPQE